LPRTPISTLFPYTTLFRSGVAGLSVSEVAGRGHEPGRVSYYRGTPYGIDSHPKLKLEIVVRVGDDVRSREGVLTDAARTGRVGRSEEHTSELHSLTNLLCR